MKTKNIHFFFLDKRLHQKLEGICIFVLGEIK